LTVGRKRCRFKVQLAFYTEAVLTNAISTQ